MLRPTDPTGPTDPTREIASFNLRTPEDREAALQQFDAYMALADAGELEGFAMRRQMADGRVEYDIYGDVSPEDLTELILRCARDLGNI